MDLPRGSAELRELTWGESSMRTRLLVGRGVLGCEGCQIAQESSRPQGQASWAMQARVDGHGVRVGPGRQA